MSRLAVILMLVVFVCVSVTYGLKCYKCDSAPCKALSQHITCLGHEKCFIKYMKEEVVARGCMMEDQCKTLSINQAKCQSCGTDSCNSAHGAAPALLAYSPVALFAALVLALAVVKM